MTGFGYKVVNEIRICFEQWAKNKINSTETVRNISPKLLIPKILAHERAELVKLGNQLILQEWKLAQKDFRDLILEYQNIDGVTPETRKCCACLESPVIFLTREEVALDYFCSTMKKILIGILNKSNETRMKNRLLMNENNNKETYEYEEMNSSPTLSEATTTSYDDSSMEILHNPLDKDLPLIYSYQNINKSNISCSTNLQSDETKNEIRSRNKFKKNLSDPLDQCSCKTERFDSSEIPLLISGFDIINKRLKRSVSTQTEEIPSIRSFFHVNSSKKKPRTPDELTVRRSEEYDTLPYRLKIAIENQSLNKRATESKEDSKCSEMSPFLCEELVEALKKIELVQLATKEGESLRGRKKFRRSHYFRRPLHITPTSSSSSSSYSSTCSSPTRCLPLDSSFYSVFTISGNLPETADTNGKYSFKSYSVAHY